MKTSRTDRGLRTAIGLQLLLLGVALMLWQLWASPPQVVPAGVIATLIIVPLAGLLPGIILGWPRVGGVWAPLMLLFYFTWGMTETVANADERNWAIVVTLLSISAFSTALFYAARHRRPRRQLSDSR